MPHIEVDVDTTLAPEEVVAALTDFSPERPTRWTGVAPAHYEVYSVGATSADVKEGTRSGPLNIWAREHYDWSEPGKVRWTVEESNFCTPGSYVEAAIQPHNGGSRIHLTWERTGTSLMYRAMFRMIKLSKGKPIADSARQGFANYEASVT